MAMGRSHPRRTSLFFWWESVRFVRCSNAYPHTKPRPLIMNAHGVPVYISKASRKAAQMYPQKTAVRAAPRPRSDNPLKPNHLRTFQSGTLPAQVNGNVPGNPAERFA